MAEWFRRQSAKIKTRDRKEIAEGAWLKCPQCNEVLYRTMLEENYYMCTNCKHHFRINGFDYVNLLLDKGEFFILILFGLLGIMIMISANSMLVMYLGLETLALSLYALVALDRNSSIAAESAMKYFILGAIASGSLLYGISWVYGITGSLEFNEI